MASKRQAAPAADTTDPTVTTDAAAPDAPVDGGWHPARPASEVSHSADRISYRDNPDKEDESSVAQLADIPEDFPLQAGRSGQ